MKNKIALIVPSYNKTSENWIWRQVNYLHDDISLVAIRQPVPRKNDNQFKFLNISKLPPFIFRLLKKIS